MGGSPSARAPRGPPPGPGRPARPARPARRPARGARAAGAARLASREPEGAASPLEVAGSPREDALCPTTAGRLVRWGGVRAASVLTFCRWGGGEKNLCFAFSYLLAVPFRPTPMMGLFLPKQTIHLNSPSGPRTRRCRGCFRCSAIVRSDLEAFFRARVPPGCSGRRSRGTRTPSAQAPRVPGAAASFRGIASSENSLFVILVFTVKSTGDVAGA